MAEQKIITTKTPNVSITHCHGDLVIRAGMETAVTLKGDDFSVDESETGLSLSSNSDLKVMLPAQSAIAIEAVSGDLVIKNVSGDLSLGEMKGDVLLSGVGHVKINTIKSDLSAKNVNSGLTATLIQGDAVFRRVSQITLQTVQGDTSVKSVDGAVHIAEAGGDISLRSIMGDVTVQQCQRDVNLSNLGGQTAVTGVQGDIRLRGGLSAADHVFEAQRDIIVRWPLEAPLDFSATAPQIINKVALEKAVEAENSLTGRLGDGETMVSFTAGGRFILKEGNVVDSKWETEYMDGESFNFDFANIGEQISAQVNEQINRVTAQIETKFGPDFTDNIIQKVMSKAEQATARAERSVQRERARAERQAARNARRAHGRYSTTPSPSAPKKATEEEQIKILKMVEQGIISPDEANTLLDALEK